MQIISYSSKETVSIGKAIARHLKPQDIIALSGELGSGKTILAKGIASGLKIPSFCVTSSSFVIVKPHLSGKIPFYHFDLYRLKTSDIPGLGYEEYFYGEGVSVIEWPERMGCFLPREHLKIELSYQAESERKLKFFPRGERYNELIKKIHENISN